MGEEMAVKNNGGLDKDVPEVSKTGYVNRRRDDRKTPRARGRSGRAPHTEGDHRQAKKAGQRARSGNKRDDGRGSADYNLDVSLQEELMSGNLRLRGRKAQVSINHLLQFQLPEIERQQGTHRKSGRKKNDGGNHVHLHGESFINANYRLLVDDSSEYKEQSADPNIPVPQEKIVRVIVPKGQNCPICLAEEPVAPHMVACGHIFCLSCLLNFFAVEDKPLDKSAYTQKKSLKECPLCGSIVRSNKVKPVLVEDIKASETVEAGTETTLKLMCKPHGSILPLPVELGVDALALGNVPSLDFPEVADYAHIIKCSSAKAVELFQKDIDGIKTQHEIDKILYNDDGKYYKMASEYLSEKITKVLSQHNDDEPAIDKAMKSLNLGVDLQKKYHDSNAFFFYQTAFHSSTRFFLSPLDVKILLSAFHHYSEFPQNLQAVVENVIYGSVVTSEMISRYKYFGHLPLGTEIAFIEIDWRDNPILPKEVYQQFVSELKQRRRKLSMRKHKEDKQKLNYQKRLEREHAEFYRRENGEILSTQEIHALALTDDYLLDSLSSSRHELNAKTNSGPTDDQDRRPAYKERTIWGTSISVIPDEKSSKENQEFETMLLQKMQQDDEPESSSGSASKKNNKKKKNKVMLFSNTHRTL